MKTNNKTNDARTYVKPAPMMKSCPYDHEQLSLEETLHEIGQIFAIGYLRMKAERQNREELHRNACHITTS